MSRTSQTASPPVKLSHKRVLKIALPVVIANATVPILGAVDTGVVGQMGLAAPIGAVGIGAIILGAAYWMFGFLRMGTSGLTSQARGAGDNAEVSAMLTRTVLIGLAIGIAMVAIQGPLFWAAFKISPASPEVETLAREYMNIRIFSAPATIGLYALSGWLIALERTRAVLVLQLWMNGLNIGLDLWFVLGLGWGVGGVGLATFLAEWSGLFLGIWLCRDGFLTPQARNWARVFSLDRLRVVMTVNRDIMLRSFLLQTMFVSFLFMGAEFDDVTLAANQVLLQFLHIVAYGMDGFAIAAETLIGQAMGARNRLRLRRAALMTSFWAMITVIMMSITFAIFGRMIIDLMATAPDVRERAYVFLIYMILAPLVGMASWMLDGIFIGATKSRDMRNMMAISFVIYCICVATLVPIWGNHGLWISLLISYVARAVTLGLRYPALEMAADRP